MQGKRRPQHLLLVLSSIALLLACTPGQRPQLMVQLCVKDDPGVSEFMNMMRSIAVSENMKFVDGSAQTQQELKTIDAKMAKLDTSGSVINIGIDNPHGHTIMMGGNLGLPTYQIALGFGDPENPAEARRLANVVIKQLGRRWPVQTLPTDTGALPMKSCPGKI